MQSTIVLTQGITTDQFTSEIRPVSTDPNLSVQRLAQYFKGQTGGNYTSGIQMDLTIGSVAATATLTVSTTGPTNAETMSLLGTTFTAVTSGATGNQFNISATASVVATNIANAINNSATAVVTKNVSAAAVGAVVTLTAKTPGTIGNFLDLTESLTNVALVAFAGGTDGTAYTFDLL